MPVSDITSTSPYSNQKPSDHPDEGNVERISNISDKTLKVSESIQSKLSSRKIELLKPSSTPLLKKIWKAVRYCFSTIIKLVFPVFGVDYEHRRTDKYRQYSECILSGFEATESCMSNLKMDPKNKDVLDKLKQAGSFLKANITDEIRIDCKSNFKSFLETLRTVMTSDAYKSDPFIKMMVDRYCFAMYAHVNISPYTKNLVPKATGINAQDSTLNFADQLKNFTDVYDSISMATHLISPWDYIGQSIKGHWTESLGLDPNMQGGPPYQKFTLTCKGKKAVNIRIPTPTIGTEVNSEFKGYLEFLKVSQQKHLYINLQQASKHKAYPGENERSNNLIKLSQETKYKDVLTVVTLDKNSPFYFQKNEFENMDIAEEFKKKFLERMFSSKTSDSGFYFPDRIGDFSKDQLKEWVKTSMDTIHREFFSNTETLDKKKRQNFIELSYNLLISKLLDISNANYYNNSCKDCIDRGGGTSALMAFSIQVLAPENTNTSHETNLGLMFADAILVRKRPIVHERMVRALEALEVLLNASDKAKQWMYSEMNSPVIEHA
jgi:hypothetical protein